jgi:hypothetical protein
MFLVTFISSIFGEMIANYAELSSQIIQELSFDIYSQSLSIDEIDNLTSNIVFQLTNANINVANYKISIMLLDISTKENININEIYDILLSNNIEFFSKEDLLSMKELLNLKF